MDTKALQDLINSSNPHAKVYPLTTTFPTLLNYTKGLKAGNGRQLIIPQGDYSPENFPPPGRYYQEVGAKVFFFSLYPNAFYPALTVDVQRVA